MAAALFYGIALNHPFHNGNKRAAVVSLICLADANDLAITASEQELRDFVLDVVNHKFRPDQQMAASIATDIEVSEIATWIRTHMKKKEHFQRIVRWALRINQPEAVR
jgi:death-on-curing protein